MIKTVKTKYGILEGVTSNAGFALFRGIPYAAPPVGNLRWRPPQEPEAWEGIRKCDTYGPACVQYDRWGDATDDITDDSDHPYILIPNYPYPPKMSEDCLYLNIYTPAESDKENLPVLFYVHGGGFQQWYGSDYEYCGDGFCKHGCIVVSITYRLNVFGYFAHPDLAKESEHNTSGNYGLLDQIQALKWVYENIRGFGGNPDNITIFGQSAGGNSCVQIWSSPLSKNYIAHMSLQSCGGLRGFTEYSRETIEQKGIEFMKNVGCSSIEEMRALSADVLRIENDKLGGLKDGFRPYADGYVLPYTTDECILKGINRDIDIIIGATVDEGYNEKEPQFGIDMYHQSIEFAKAQLEVDHKPVYLYLFDREQPGDDIGVPHSCDNRYQFATLDGSWRPYTEQDYELSERMQQYWSNFARTGNPNGEGLEVWETFKEAEEYLHLRVKE